MLEDALVFVVERYGPCVEHVVAVYEDGAEALSSVQLRGLADELQALSRATTNGLNLNNNHHRERILRTLNEAATIFKTKE